LRSLSTAVTAIFSVSFGADPRKLGFRTWIRQAPDLLRPWRDV
jgi:hypothetical protein